MSNLNNEDVVSTGMSDPLFAFGLGATFKVIEFVEAAKNAVGFCTPPIAHNQWFTETGIMCKVLLANGGGWKSGRIRLRVEFIPDDEISSDI